MSVTSYQICRSVHSVSETVLVDSRITVEFTLHLHDVRLGQAASKPMVVWFRLPVIDPPNGRPHPPWPQYRYFDVCSAEPLSCFRLMLLRATEQKQQQQKPNGVRHLLRLPQLQTMIMKCQVITYQGVLMLSYANHDNEVSSDHLSGSSYVIICKPLSPCFSLFSEFGILWLLVLPTCSLFQHCSCLAWRWQLTIKALLHCVLPGFHHTHTLMQNTVIITICTQCQ